MERTQFEKQYKRLSHNKYLVFVELLDGSVLHTTNYDFKCDDENYINFYKDIAYLGYVSLKSIKKVL